MDVKKFKESISLVMLLCRLLFWFLGLNNQKNGLSRNTSGALGISGLQPKYRFQISQ
jgi:hypothetical protein